MAAIKILLRANNRLLDPVFSLDSVLGRLAGGLGTSQPALAQVFSIREFPIQICKHWHFGLNGKPNT